MKKVPFIKSVSLQKRITFFFLFLVSLLMFFYGLFWLIGLVWIAYVVHVVFLNAIQLLVKRNIPKQIARKIWFVLWILSLSICCRLFVWDVFRVPSSSMENTLFPEDIILVNKLSYGPKTPQSISEIPWINLLFSPSEKDAWNSRRWSGITHIRQGDVLVFQQANSNFAVKRCVGLAGQQFQLIDGSIYTDHQKYNSTSTIKKSYEIRVADIAAFFQQTKELHLSESIYPVPEKSDHFEGHLTQADVEQLRNVSAVHDIQIQEEKSETYPLFPLVPVADWTVNDMGPFVIPYKGFTIQLTDFNVNLYKKTLENYENAKLSKKGNFYYNHGKRIETYTFQKAYVFVMGDHRKESEDSRFYGFVPEETIVGKVQCVLYATDNGEFLWNRLFKSVQEKTPEL